MHREWNDWSRAWFSLATTGAFTINASTGAITVANPAAIDFETTPSFALTVQVADDHGHSDTATVTVNLTDVPENQTVQMILGGGAASWVKKQPPVTVLPQVTVSGTAILTGGTLTLTTTAIGPRKKLMLQYSASALAALGTVSAPQLSGDHITIQIQLGPNASYAGIQSFLRSIKFATKGKGLKIPVQTLTATLSAGGHSSSVSQTINVRKKP